MTAIFNSLLFRVGEGDGRVVGWPFLALGVVLDLSFQNLQLPVAVIVSWIADSCEYRVSNMLWKEDCIFTGVGSVTVYLTRSDTVSVFKVFSFKFSFIFQCE
jgi:hypothetical protein